MPATPRHGPLAGVRIVIVGGIGPGPYAAMLLADLGADVVRIERRDETARLGEILARNQRSVALDLKSADGLAAARGLIARADALIEGFRPGVMERLGLGPDDMLAANPKLVFGRMTGWGQTGPLANAAGHDINYIALSGALAAIGTAERPVLPLNLVGDFGGGALFLCMGLLAGIVNARSTGRGQVVDCAMVEGAASLMTMFYGFLAEGTWGARGGNFLDGGAPWYDTYRCADGRFVALGPIEPAFYAELRRRLGLADEAGWDAQNDASRWPAQKEALAALVATRTRDQWCELLEGSDACFAPVLDMTEAPLHPHNVARGSFVPLAGRAGDPPRWQPAPAPRFAATPCRDPLPPPPIGAHTAEVLRDWGVAASPPAP